jgi:predicted Zn finger-like uncharacterized protein
VTPPAAHAQIPMPEENYTRCPGCATVFRVTSEQLAMRAGQVRCGQCKTVFDGNAQRVSLAPPPEPAVALPAAMNEAALGPPTVTLRDAQALEPPDIAAEPTIGAVPVGAAAIAYEDRFSPLPALKPRRTRAVLYAAATAFLILLIVAQAIYHFRDAVAAHWPAAQPVLARICDVAGCTIRPLRDPAMSYLSIDASDLQADSAHRGLLILTATLRNRAAWSLAYPYLELTLTDAQDQIVVRRALAPADYAGGTADLQRGIPANGEVAVKLFIDASATTQVGYRLYMFYP